MWDRPNRWARFIQLLPSASLHIQGFSLNPGLPRNSGRIRVTGWSGVYLGL